jgi:hypothetical protein
MGYWFTDPEGRRIYAGGESFSGSSGGGYSYWEGQSISRWRASSQDFCRPTFCPRCGAPVFFIQHNDGCVWVDELGWPWPKHDCFHDDCADYPKLWPSPNRFKASDLRYAQLAQVVACKRLGSGNSKWGEAIQCDDGTRFCLVLSPTGGCAKNEIVEMARYIPPPPVVVKVTGQVIDIIHGELVPDVLGLPANWPTHKMNGRGYMTKIESSG